MTKSDERDRDFSALVGPLLAELVDVDCETAFWRTVNRVIAFVPEGQRAEMTEALLAATTAWATEVTHRAIYLASTVRTDALEMRQDAPAPVLTSRCDNEIH